MPVCETRGQRAGCQVNNAKVELNQNTKISRPK
jgi:hypothetical protein